MSRISRRSRLYIMLQIGYLNCRPCDLKRVRNCMKIKWQVGIIAALPAPFNSSVRFKKSILIVCTMQVQWRSCSDILSLPSTLAAEAVNSYCLSVTNRRMTDVSNPHWFLMFTELLCNLTTHWVRRWWCVWEAADQQISKMIQHIIMILKFFNNNLNKKLNCMIRRPVMQQYLHTSDLISWNLYVMVVDDWVQRWWIVMCSTVISTKEWIALTKSIIRN